MNKEIKQQWVSALRSGDYKQGRTALERTDGRFCCLGVLSKIASDAGVIKRSLPTGLGSVLVTYGADAHFLPDAVVAWAGLEGGEDRNDLWKLADLNDSGSPFTEIADIIEKSF